jgi:hypothetical protein
MNPNGSSSMLDILSKTRELLLMSILLIKNIKLLLKLTI